MQRKIISTHCRRPQPSGNYVARAGRHAPNPYRGFMLRSAIPCFGHLQEFQKWDAEPGKHTKSHSFWSPRQGAHMTCSVQHERFLAPELFFRPDFVSTEYTTPLPQVRKP